MGWWTYRRRKRLGFVRPRPRRLTRELKQTIARRYLARERKQIELALEYDVSQATIARCIAEYGSMVWPARAYNTAGRTESRDAGRPESLRSRHEL